MHERAGSGIVRSILAPGRLVLACAALHLARPDTAFGHDGAPPAPHDLWTAWSWEPAVLVGIALGAWIYGRGVRTLWREAGRGRGVRVGQAAAFAGGLFCLFVALISPLDALGSALFSAHMVQHLVLMLGAAPLLVLGAPLVGAIWAFPQGVRQALGRGWRRARRLRAAVQAVGHPLPAWTLHAVALWAWHTPALYDAAVRSEPVHVIEHASFLGTALLFWWVVAHRGGRLWRTPGVGLLYIFAFAMQSGILGALLTFSDTVWYGSHLQSTAPWGLTPLDDQQLAGAIMWFPASLVYLGALGALLVHWLRAAEEAVRRGEERRRADQAPAR